MFTLDFKLINKDMAHLAGGKGASLGEMTNVDISVPPGFVITADAFDKFIIDADIDAEIETILKAVNHNEINTVEYASAKIQNLILGAKMSEEFAIEIKQSFKKLNAKYVAVRSSATAEDSSEDAWAGQLESYLNTTEKSLLENVKKCWASLFTPRAIYYRFEKGLNTSKISVAVVVQKMVKSEKSGIAFSVHPVTEDYNQLIIEAGFGLGEAIVSGAITPDSYVVDKTRISNSELRIDEAIVDINVSTKNKGLFQGENGGNEWKDIPGAQASSQVLLEKEILELSKLIIKIENHYGFPCDIEWAQENGKFYITQSRPITTLTKKELFLKEKYVKIFNRSLFVMSCQNYDLGERLETAKASPVEYSMDPVLHNLPSKGTDVYYNFSDPKQDPKLIVDYFNSHREQLLKLKDEYYANCDILRALITDLKHDDYQRLFDLTAKIWPLVAISNMLGDNRDNIKGVDSDLVLLYREMRKYSDGLIHNSHLRIAEILRKIVPKKYKKYYKYLKYEEVVNGEYPNMDDLENRKKGYIYHKGNLTTNVSLDEYAKKNNYEFIGFKADDNFLENSISGQVAYGGVAKGRVKVIFEIEDINRVKKGDILVTSMTTPDFILAMQKANAFVTDEGGITCHASIVAREIKKPCIIGTKIATQVLKDGDLVEVDADNGIVNILERVGVLDKDKNEKIKNGLNLLGSLSFSKQISYEFIPVICFESAMRSYKDNPLQKQLGIGRFPVVIEILTDKFEGWDDQHIEKINELKDIKFVIKESRLIIKKHTKAVNNLLQKDYAKLEKEGFVQSLEEVDDICMEVYQRYLYFIHEFFETDNLELIKLLPEVRIELSEFVGNIYTICDRMIKALSERFDEVPWRAFTYATFEEIIDILKGDIAINDFKKINGRSILFIYNDGNLSVIKDRDLISEINIYLAKHKNSKNIQNETISGHIAFGGMVQGVVVMILEHEYKKVNEILEKRSGYVLVTPMTRPEIVPYLKNANAIVTDEGGITCHASIISRELNIPCIVGTGVATQVLKDGDLVEVDADNGVVRILKKYKNEKTK